jgi:3-phosphoshikimate 1-carboxyvinyltransferase
VVEPGPISGLELVIEPDLSNAGPFLAAALVAGGQVTVADWPEQTDQVGREFERILPLMGGTVERLDQTSESAEPVWCKALTLT